MELPLGKLVVAARRWRLSAMSTESLLILPRSTTWLVPGWT